MKKAAVFAYLFIFCALGFPFASFADQFEIKDDRDFEEVVVKTRVICEYSVFTKIPNYIPFTKEKVSFFNSFFVGHTIVNNTYREKLIASGHSFLCNDSFNDVFADKIDLVVAETFLKTALSVFIVHQGTEFGSGKILKVLHGDSLDISSDVGLFEIDIPINSFHKHVSVGVNTDVLKWVGVGSRVVVRGFMYPADAAPDTTRYKVGYVEHIGNYAMRISTSIYPGMSGSIVTLKRKNKWYAVGVISQFVYNEHYGILDFSWASLIPKGFIDTK